MATTTMKRTKTAKPVAEQPFHIVVSRGIARFLDQQNLNPAQAADKYQLHYRAISRLIKEPTPGMIGENIDKVCRAFGITRQELIDLGTPIA